MKKEDQEKLSKVLNVLIYQADDVLEDIANSDGTNTQENKDLRNAQDEIANIIHILIDYSGPYRESIPIPIDKD